MTEPTGFEPEPPEPEQLHVASLVASRRALLKPERREQRLGILVDSILSVLAGLGPLPREHVRASVSRLWETGSITESLFDGAVDAAKAAGFITEQRQDLHGVPHLDIAATEKADIEKDKEWVDGVLAAVTAEIESRLPEYPDIQNGTTAKKISNHLITAIASGIVGYELEQQVAERTLVPVDIDESSIAAYAASIQPRSLREPVRDMALAALDPDEAFGNEIVRLIVAGNLLHGIVTQQGATLGSLDSVRLLLDTSVLTDLTADGSPEDAVLRRAIESSRELGISVYVAHHTVDEWNRQWAFADDEAQWITGNTIPVFASRFERNPFLRNYLSAVSSPEETPFATWAASRRDLPRLLDTLGVELIEHGITRDENVERVETVRRALLDTGRRTERAAEADAHSAVMVAKWREEHGSDTAFFLARERFTGEAFRRHIDDEHPLVVSPASWLLYITHLGADDAEEAADLADLIAKAVVRRTMLEVACKYTYEEVLRLEQTLTELYEVTPRDARELGMPQLFDLAALESEDLTAEHQASLLLRAKARRDIERSNRKVAAAEAVTAEAQARQEAAEANAEQRVLLEQARSAQLSEQLSAKSKERDLVDEHAKDEITKLKRRFTMGIVLALLVGGTTVGHFLELWDGRVTLIATAGIVWLAAKTWEYVNDPKVKSTTVALTVVAEVALLAIATLTGRGG